MEEFVPFVENRFPIRQEADQRTLAGDSLGGTVSLQLALDHPNRFRNILSLSGAFFEPSFVRIQAEQDLSWLTMYMVAGLDETAVQTDAGTFNFLEINRKTKKLLEEKKLTFIILKDLEPIFGDFGKEKSQMHYVSFLVLLCNIVFCF